MKKILFGVYLGIICIAFVSCSDSEGNNGSKNAQIGEFNKKATIEETVVYNDNNVKITAGELTFDDYNANLEVIIDNNTGKEMSFICGSMGYDVNSVNGYMADDGYINCDVATGESVSETLSFSIEALKAYGITEVSDIEFGFLVQNTEDATDWFRTGAVAVKTSLAEKHDYSENTYQKILKNGAFENEFECESVSFSDEDSYSQNGIVVSSAAVMTNSDGAPILMLEIVNGTKDLVKFSILELKLNDKMVYDGYWSGALIGANKTYVESSSLVTAVKRYDGDKSEVSKVKKVSFTLDISKFEGADIDSTTVTIELPDINVPVDED